MGRQVREEELPALSHRRRSKGKRGQAVVRIRNRWSVRMEAKDGRGGGHTLPLFQGDYGIWYWTANLSRSRRCSWNPDSGSRRFWLIPASNQNLTSTITIDAIEGSPGSYYHNLDKNVDQKDMKQKPNFKNSNPWEGNRMQVTRRRIMESQGIEKDRLTKEVESSQSRIVCALPLNWIRQGNTVFPIILQVEQWKNEELKALYGVIRKGNGRNDRWTDRKIEMMLEQKQEELFAAVEAADTVLQKKAIAQHLRFISVLFPWDARTFILKSGMRWNDG